MNNYFLDSEIPKEIINNITEFYKSHREECDSFYLNANDENLFSIYQEVNNENLLNRLFFKSSIIILTANRYEKNILHLKAVQNQEQKIYHYCLNVIENPEKPFSINIYFFKFGDYNILHLEARNTGSYSMGGSADIIRFLLKNKYCHPSVVISYGICFGNDITKNKIGDTIIVKKLYPYFMSAKIRENSFYVEDSNIFCINNKLDTKIQYLYGTGKISEAKGVYYGNMVTGEAVISNALMRDIFVAAATNQPILGGEMEGYGVFKECQGFECSVPCLVIKSICDWGAGKNISGKNSDPCLKDKLQAYAANKACNLLLTLLKKETQLFNQSIYERVKSELINKEVVIPKALIEQILKDTLSHIEKYDINANYEILVALLLEEGIIKKANGKNVFLLNEV